MSAPSQRGGNKVVVAGTTFHNMDPVLILNEPRILSGTVHAYKLRLPSANRTDDSRQADPLGTRGLVFVLVTRIDRSVAHALLTRTSHERE